MSEMKTLSVQKRDALGKGPNRRLREEALVPAVYYAPDGKNILVQVALNPLNKIYEQVGRTNVFNLEIEENGTKTAYPVFVWDAQYHPVKNTFTHVDFYGVDLDKEIHVKVRLRFVGTSKGVKAGGKMEVYREEVTLIAKPQDMPRIVDIDITDFEIGTNLRASELKLPEGVRVEYKSDFSILTVMSKDKAKDEGDE
ncbi:50S ribosomal protein L25/general stress protein Ctc [Taurinivorans muris]|jgi:ribosomal protein L25, Ctc-form|uniref:Large ribosomal subunit protein bL25 n=1 Tax=Taurinivorans muris TaxID=2787751 RepID=A0ABY5XYX6_9BACT|nr:50S ribosomal protein L25/general stress protein Ctc [Mailhella sp.]UWX05102.1 50S ribosomal protein L25/general stress protein Ctc [Desulfovibrionaceae bacterium LT0009]HBV41417.1 50S ribosomal protein L25 [Desulfovibrio sp.]